MRAKVPRGGENDEEMKVVTDPHELPEFLPEDGEDETTANLMLGLTGMSLELSSSKESRVTKVEAVDDSCDTKFQGQIKTEFKVGQPGEASNPDKGGDVVDADKAETPGLGNQELYLKDPAS